MAGSHRVYTFCFISSCAFEVWFICIGNKLSHQPVTFCAGNDKTFLRLQIFLLNFRMWLLCFLPFVNADLRVWTKCHISVSSCHRHFAVLPCTISRHWFSQNNFNFSPCCRPQLKQSPSSVPRSGQTDLCWHPADSKKKQNIHTRRSDSRKPMLIFDPGNVSPSGPECQMLWDIVIVSFSLPVIELFLNQWLCTFILPQSITVLVIDCDKQVQEYHKIWKILDTTWRTRFKAPSVSNSCFMEINVGFFNPWRISWNCDVAMRNKSAATAAGGELVTSRFKTINTIYVGCPAFYFMSRSPMFFPLFIYLFAAIRRRSNLLWLKIGVPMFTTDTSAVQTSKISNEKDCHVCTAA